MAGTCLPSSAKPGAPLEAPQQEDHPDVGGPAGEDAVEERAPLADRTNNATEGGVAAAKEVPGGSKGKGRKARCGKLLLTNKRGRALINALGSCMSSPLGLNAFQGHWNDKNKVKSRDEFYAKLWSKEWRAVEKWSALCGEEECRFPSQRTLFDFFDNVVLPAFKAEQDRKVAAGVEINVEAETTQGSGISVGGAGPSEDPEKENEPKKRKASEKLASTFDKLMKVRTENLDLINDQEGDMTIIICMLGIMLAIMMESSSA